MSIKNILSDIKQTIIEGNPVIFTDTIISEFMDEYNIISYLVEFSSDINSMNFISSPLYKEKRSDLLKNLDLTVTSDLIEKIKDTDYCEDLLVLRYLEVKNKMLKKNIDLILKSIRKSLEQW